MVVKVLNWKNEDFGNMVTGDYPSHYGLPHTDGPNPQIPPPEIEDKTASLSAFTTHRENPQTQEEIDIQLKKDKEDLYNHPLFPLLVCIFEKCELATCQNPKIADKSKPSEMFTSDSFSTDIDQFAKDLKTNKSIFTSNAEMDNLLIQAIQVLRFHLLELEKVHELCDNFCKRYIDCLKGKMPLDIVLEDGDKKDMPKMDDETTDMQNTEHSPKSQNPSWSSLELSSCTVGYQSKQPLLPHGMTHTTEPVNNNTQIDPIKEEINSTAATEIMPDSEDSPFKDEDDEKDKRKQKKRGIFPKMATNIMKQWLYQNLNHPYPTEEGKRQLANETGLTILQVNNWFINARRRIVQPLIDANRAGKTPVINPMYKSRKRKNSGSDSISPGPYPYPPMGGHYSSPYLQEHYGMYSNYHADLTGSSTTQQHAHYSPRSYASCPSDSMGSGGVNLPQTSCAPPMRAPPHTYGGYRTSPPIPSAQSPYLGHNTTHPSLMQSNAPNLHGYHQASTLSAYAPAPTPSHPYATHDSLSSHGVLDIHNS